MAIRLSGLNSGMDTESIVAELVKPKTDKKEQLELDQKKFSWKQDAWKELNSKIYGLYSKTLSNMRLQSDFIKKKTNVTNSAVSIVTGSNAPNVQQSMYIRQMAKAGYLTGAKVKVAEGEATAKTKMSELGLELAEGEETFFTVSSAGKDTKIVIKADTTIKEVTDQLKKAGVNANFDEINQRFYINAKKTGKENDFTITTGSAKGLEAMSKLGIASSLDDDANTKALYEAYAAKVVYTTNSDGSKTIDEAATKANLKDYIDREVAEAIKDRDYAGTINKAKESIKDLEEKKATSQTEKDKLTEELTAANKELEDAKAAAGDSPTDEQKAKIDELTKKSEELQKKSDNLDKTIKDYDEKLKEVNEDLTDASKYYDIEKGEATQALVDEITVEEFVKAEDAVEMLEVYKSNGHLMNAVRVAGQDSEITLNGVNYTSEGNAYSINDLTITINNMTSDEIVLTTVEDTDGIYDMVKDFFKEYNALINEMDKLYNADSAYKYDMLTDEEREAMNEDDIKEWDGKIKSALLRRDETLGNVATAMKQVMMSGIKLSSGNTMYLSDFGITTLGYFGAKEDERNAYHIDGNPDDGKTAGNPDKLKAMIAKDPETVSEFFSSLTKNLYDKLDELMKSSDYSSAYTVYNDKLMKEEYKGFTEKIGRQEKIIADYEDRYYRKFSDMEVAMAKLNNQQSSIASLFGM